MGDNSHFQAITPEDLDKIKQIDVGNIFTAVLDENGRVTTWGTDGEFRVPENLEPVSKIAAGGNHMLALQENGKLIGWGKDTFGECSVPKGLGNIKDFKTEAGATIVLKEDGTVVAWGNNFVEKVLYSWESKGCNCSRCRDRFCCSIEK